MGHCGYSTNGANLFSLRQDMIIDKAKINKSILTAAIDDDGMILQLKGVKNSKPKEEYHKYIAALLLLEENGKKVINGFKAEYKPDADFNLNDIKDNDFLKKIIKENPNLVYQLSTRVTLAMRLKDKTINSYLIGDITPDKLFFEKIVYKSNRYTSHDILYKIYNGEYDSYDLLSNKILNHSEFADSYNNEINNENKETILKILKDVNQNQDNIEESLSELSNINIDNLTDYIKSRDDYYYFRLKDSGVISAVSRSLDLCNVNSQIEQIIKEINSFLSYFGNTSNHGKIKINLLELVKEAIEITGDEDKVFGILNDLEYNDIEDAGLDFIIKCYNEDIYEEKLSIDTDDIYPKFNKESFNEILQDELASI